APPEYVIIGKLEFFGEGGSEKHLRDIRGMLAMTEVDRAVLEKEIARRSLEDAWRKCQYILGRQIYLGGGACHGFDFVRRQFVRLVNQPVDLRIIRIELIIPCVKVWARPVS